MNSEVETVGWAILQALHEGVEDGPQSWSDMASDQEKRIEKAAIAAIEAVTGLSQYKAQGFSLPLTKQPSELFHVQECEDGWYGLAQLRAALVDIDISAYNAAKWRIGKAMAVLSKALSLSKDSQQRAFDTTGTTLRRSCNVFTITCEDGETANRLADQLRSPAVPNGAAPPAEDVRGRTIEGEDGK